MIRFICITSFGGSPGPHRCLSAQQFGGISLPSTHSTCHTISIVGQGEGVTLPDENSYQSEQDYLFLRYLYEGSHTRQHIDRQPNVHTVADYRCEGMNCVISRKEEGRERRERGVTAEPTRSAVPSPRRQCRASA